MSGVRVAALGLGLSAVGGCALVLGGLEEGTPNTADAAGGVEAVAHAPCADYPPGFRRRASVVVDNPGAALEGHPIAVAVDLAALGAASKVRADRRDVRFANLGGGGLPHWVSPRGEVWVRADVPAGASSLWIYYDAPDAPAASSISETFVRGVIDDHAFGGSSWTVAHLASTLAPSSTDQWSVVVADGAVTARLIAPARPNGETAALCAMMLFPGGGPLRVAADVDVFLADGATAMMFAGQASLWGTAALGSTVATSDVVVAPGYHRVCFGVTVHGSTVGTGAEARFSNPRVVRSAPGGAEPRATVLADTEESCP